MSSGPCLSLTGARFHDIVVSLQVSRVPCVTLTMLCAYQSDVFVKRIHRKKRIDQGQHCAYQQEAGQNGAGESNEQT